jgi:CysZ protein
MVDSFLLGASMPWKALKLIVRQPVLLLLSLIPTGLTLGLYALGFQALQSGAQETIRGLLASWGMSPDGITAAAILLLVSLVLILVGAVTFSITASLLATPLNDFLAELTESRCEPKLAAAPPANWRRRLHLIRIDLVKTVVAGMGLLVTVLLSWIPVLNILSFGIAFLLMTFQFVTYPQTRRGLGVIDGLRFPFRHLFASLGFGGIFTVLFALPLISCLALPLAVVGGTILFAHSQTPGLR